MANRSEAGRVVHRKSLDSPSWRPLPRRIYKSRDSQVTSQMMAAVRGRENKAEITLRKALWRLGYRYRLQSRKLIGRPDIVLPKHHAVIFVDGDYWHGRALREGGEDQLRHVIRGPRFEWWRDKLARNIGRDDHVTRTLQHEGWKVIRVWESDVLRHLDASVRRVVKELERP